MPTSVRDVGSGCPIAVVPPSITNNQVGKMRLRVSSHCYELRQVIFTHSKLFCIQSELNAERSLARTRRTTEQHESPKAEREPVKSGKRPLRKSDKFTTTP